ncbi:MAG: hypothetical protein BGO70_03285 [Bacteroidetes bacterium 43-93]|uniref:hypothetical protein n=1 Tax=uncultured Dysgonomonas sp. TaxID=206096 RepID=UPI000927BB60|nr:hypothetical protein [uncultured Dysgonomonas sp.]MBN9484019.1 hypothetical protein [Bacteroidota bacterium]OJW98923.1 MAG: hypothetical protein BGO70_03285 [Bacteroidetes bacterium 43-93]
MKTIIIQLWQRLLDVCSEVCFYISDRYSYHKIKFKKRIDDADFEKLHEYIEKKSEALFNHENNVHKKNPQHKKQTHAHIGLSRDKWHLIFYKKRIFAIGATRVFYDVIHSTLPRAIELHKEKFGTRNAKDVLDALYETVPEGSREAFDDFLGIDNFAYITELRNGKPVGKLLRVTFFRQIDPDPKGVSEFTSGVFHAYKHFTYKGVALSTVKENYSLSHPSQIFRYLINGFFFCELYEERRDKPFWVADMPVGPKRIIKFVFHHEANSDTYSVSSVSKRNSP